MAALLGGLRRVRTIFNPPAAEKSEDALKFGILGAANIAYVQSKNKLVMPLEDEENSLTIPLRVSRPLALILPAKTHPEVIIYAVAARDKDRAIAYAHRYNIPNVKDDYQG